MNINTVIRIARPTDNLEEIAGMYARGLNLDELGRFTDHDGFDGIMLGHKGMAYHLEFTKKRGHNAAVCTSEENLVVLYIPESEEWERQCTSMIEAGFIEVASFNPYWDIAGKTFQDIEGYRVVLQNTKWE